VALICWDLIIHRCGVTSQKNGTLSYTTSKTSKQNILSRMYSKCISNYFGTQITPTEDMKFVIRFNFQSSTSHFKFDAQSTYVHNLETKNIVIECKKINHFNR